MKRGSASLRQSARWKALRVRWDSATAIISGVPSSGASGLLRAHIEGGLLRGADDGLDLLGTSLRDMAIAGET